MNTDETFCHAATLQIDISALEAFDLLASSVALGDWALGIWQAHEVGPRLFKGTSLLDGSTGYAQVHAMPELLQIDYHIGDNSDRLVNRITLRLVPGIDVGLDAEQALVSLICWRSANQSEDRWRMTCAAHDLEIYRLRHLLRECRRRIHTVRPVVAATGP